jgi:acid phosphatase
VAGGRKVEGASRDTRTRSPRPQPRRRGLLHQRPPSSLRESTERNLRAEGYEFDGVVLLPEGAAFQSAVDFKAPERRRLTEQGYTILISIGDQQSDLDGGFAERTFKLPNPVYFLP